MSRLDGWTHSDRESDQSMKQTSEVLASLLNVSVILKE